MNAIQELEEIKRKLEKAKEAKANIQGKISVKREQLVAMGFKDSPRMMNDVDKELDRLNLEIIDKEDSFKQKMEEFKEKYPQLFEE